VLFTENIRLAPPLVKTLRRYVGDDALWPEGFAGTCDSPDDPPFPPAWMALTLDRKLGENFLRVRAGEIGDFYDTVRTPEGQIYRWGQGQAVYIRQCVERLRRGRPLSEAEGPRRCNGHFWWKLNAAWPMIYSDLIDYYQEPTMGFYAMRRAYAPLLLSLEIGDWITLWLVNDTGNDFEGTVRFELRNGRGLAVIKQREAPISCPAGASRPVLDLRELGMLSRASPLCAWLYDGDGSLRAQSVQITGKERQIRFPEARLTLRPTAGGVIVTTDLFARCIELQGTGPDGDAFGWWFDDNFFDLLPGEEKRVRVLGRKKAGIITARAFWSPHESRATFAP
jgi:hypothetical protein